jgi:hypothetical protein
MAGQSTPRTQRKKLERELRKFVWSSGFSRSGPRERGTPNFLPQENSARQPPQKNRADFLFTVANKLWFAQWRRGDFHDFVWEHRSSNFFENFSCHHNR